MTPKFPNSFDQIRLEMKPTVTTRITNYMHEVSRDSVVLVQLILLSRIHYYYSVFVLNSNLLLQITSSWKKEYL